MRVVIDYRPALRERSGVGEYTHQLVRWLLATGNGLDITLFSSSWKDRLQLGPDVAGARPLDRRVPVSILNLAWHRLEWPSIESLALRGFDVAHSLHPLLMPSRRAAQVVTVHDLYFLRHPERTQAEIRRDYPALVRQHVRRADRIVVPSHFTAADVMEAFDLTRERIAVCSPGAPDWAPRPGPPDDGYVLFFGTLEPRKNVGGLLDAYERLVARPGGRDLPPLILAGKAPVDAQPLLERLNRAPLQGHVRHVGYIEASQRQALYAGARLLVQPSFEEGFGIPVLEAMTVGVPVVAANRGALPEVLGGAGRLVEPDDADSIADGLASLLDDPAEAARCTQRGLTRAAAYRWDEAARRVRVAYEEAVEHRRCASA